MSQEEDTGVEDTGVDGLLEQIERVYETIHIHKSVIVCESRSARGRLACAMHRAGFPVCRAEALPGLDPHDVAANVRAFVADGIRARRLIEAHEEIDTVIRVLPCCGLKVERPKRISYLDNGQERSRERR